MIKKEFCTGCGACAAICPKHSIVMQSDKEGFLYPYIQKEICVSCGLCDNVCPATKNYASMLKKAECYGIKNRNIKLQINSSSGGAFPSIAEYFQKIGGIVWGAVYSKNFRVEHHSDSKEYRLEDFSKSKYVQSDMSYAYSEIKNSLLENKIVLFSGTPCEVAAIKEFVGTKLSERLFTVELICHGVPSPMIWEQFKILLSKKYKQKPDDIVKIQFKYKDSKYNWLSPGMRVKWKNGCEYLDYAKSNWYEYGFLTNLFVRPSCHNCKYKLLKTRADISIGDYWGCDIANKEFMDSNGVSIVFTNSDKGKQILNSIISDFEIQKQNDISAVVKYNQRIITPSLPSVNRNKFWKKIHFYDKKLTYDVVDEIVRDCNISHLGDNIIYKTLRLKQVYKKRLRRYEK